MNQSYTRKEAIKAQCDHISKTLVWLIDNIDNGADPNFINMIKSALVLHVQNLDNMRAV